VKGITSRSLRRGLGLSALIVAVGSGGIGCAQSRPCMIIPAQLELAKSRRDKVKAAYEGRLEDVTRSLNNLEASRSRLENMKEERQELMNLFGGGGQQ
jgi:hypothetical protein